MAATEAPLARTPSALDGHWGEAAGHAVDVASARRHIDDAEARCDNHSVAHTISHQGTDPDPELGDTDQKDGFNLRNFLLAKSHQSPTDRKPLGVAWTDMSVLAPAKAVAGGVFVKTTPVAIMNTFWRDPWNILKTLIPPLQKLEPGHNDLVPIVHPTSGVLRAGQMLLVLGSPGSGCSTFLKAITSSLDPSVTPHGHITYGGLSSQEIQTKFRGEVVFVGEEDDHFPTVSVAETLRFALRNKVPSHASRGGMSRDEFIDQLVNVYLDMFGMPHVRETIVGNEVVRGVSGGERKRVTIAESMATRAAVQANDNTTRGLDASTALDYARSLRLIADVSQRTLLATLYQVSESILVQFDLVAVMDHGRVVYYGPRDKARQYFIDLGYQAGDRQTTCDFVTAVTDPQQMVIRPECHATAPRDAEGREAAWRQSPLYAELMAQHSDYLSAVEAGNIQEAEELKTNVRIEKNKGVRKASNFTVPFWKQVDAVIRRELQLKWAARNDIIVQILTVIIVPLYVGSMFWNAKNSSEGAFLSAGLLSFSSLFVGWSMLSEVWTAVSGRAILNRQKRFGFARPSATVIARAITDVPHILLLCTPFCIVLYFMGHLRVKGEAWALFWLLTFFGTYTMTQMYRAFCAFSPRFSEAIRWCTLALNVLFIYCGYIQPRSRMGWVVWLSWIGNLGYMLEALLANNFRENIPCVPAQIAPFNELRDVRYQTCLLSGSRPGSVIVPGKDYLQAAYGFKMNTVGREIGISLAFAALYLLVTVVASETIPWGAGASATVFARTKRAKAAMARAVGPSSQEKVSHDSDQTPAPSRPASIAPDAKDQEGESAPTHAQFEDRSVLSWKNVTLTLDSGRELLHNVSGMAAPGEMIALMGSSGAGKTTAMNAIAQRIDFGRMDGTFMVDGSPLPASFGKSVGFVMQGDIHLPTQTVREAIAFSAILRQPKSVPHTQKMKDVDEILHLLELEDLQDALIGDPGAGLSIERRKRVTIAVELAAKPSLALFLDEPTSGLDSAGAASILRMLRRLAQAGQAIVCTIHQPSEDLFQQFDRCLLLQNGGRTVYNGPIGDQGKIETKDEALAMLLRNSNMIRSYFEQMGAPPCAPDDNVAEYILELTATTRDATGHWSAVWEQSPNKAKMDQQIEEVNARRARYAGQVEDPELSGEFAASYLTQIRELIIRQYKDAYRDSSFTYSLIFSYILTGFVGSALFADMPWNVHGLQGGAFLVILILLSFPAYINSIIAKWYEMTGLFDAREDKSKVYAWWGLIVAMIVLALPLSALTATVYFLPAFFIAFYAEPTWRAGYFYLMTLLMSFYAMFFSLLIATLAPTPTIASQGVPLVLPLLFLCNGVVIPHISMPGIWKAVFWANPIAHYIRGQVANTLHGRQVTCSRTELFHFIPPPGETCGSYAGAWASASGGSIYNPNSTDLCDYCQYTTGDDFLKTLDMPFDYRWTAFGVLVVFTAVSGFACFPSYYIGHRANFSFNPITGCKRFFAKKSKKSQVGEA